MRTPGVGISLDAAFVSRAEGEGALASADQEIQR